MEKWVEERFLGVRKGGEGIVEEEFLKCVRLQQESGWEWGPGCWNERVTGGEKVNCG